MTSIQKSNTREIPLAKLVPSEANVRRTGRQNGIEQLAASIAAHGLIQSLSVRPLLDDDGKETGKFAVSGGNRRLAALKLLANRKEIAKNHPVPCIVNTGNEEEVSLAENIIRENLHPADQFEAFQRQVTEHGKSIEEIAARFGVTVQFVRQRLRLAAISPKLMQVYREDGLTLDQMMAFAITEDHARQEQVFEALSWSKEPGTIRRMLLEQHVEADDRRAVFVGAVAYEAAGGVIVRDLFSEEGDGYFADSALLDRLALLKLGVDAEALKDAEGWKWVQCFIDFPYSHGLRREFPQPVPLSDEVERKLDALQAEYDRLTAAYDDADEIPEDVAMELDRLQAETDELVDCDHVYAPEVIARTGAILSLAHDGTVRIERGFVRPEDAGAAATGTGEEGEGGEPTGLDKADSTKDRTLSDALVRDLTAHRTLGLRLALGGNPDIALIAVTHALASQLFYPFGDRVTCLDLNARETALGGFAQGIEDTAAAKALGDRHEAWSIELPQDAAKLWGFIAELDGARCMRLLAHCASLTVSAVRQPNDREPQKFATADRMAQAVALDMSAHWQPTARSYLSRVSKAQIVEAVKEVASEDAARRIAGLKKKAMAEAAEKLMAGTGWLPVLLRSLKSDQPNEAKTLAVAAE